MNGIAAQLIDWIFPHTCELCGDRTGDGSYLCPLCERQFSKPARPLCFRCGAPMPGAAADSDSCPHCSGMGFSFDFARACYLNEGPAKDLVLQMKYGRRIHLGRTLGAIMSRLWDEYPDILTGTDWLLVPVPLHPSKLRRRGYNQAGELASALAKRTKLTLCDALVRRRDGDSQTRLTREERFRHVKSLYAVKPSIRQKGILANKNVLVIDDVLTTGSTAESCARALKSNGAGRIGILSFLRSRKLHPDDPA